MNQLRDPSPELIQRIARELIGTPVVEQDLEALAGLLRALVAEMAPMRAMPVGRSEPATTYDPSEP